MTDNKAILIGYYGGDKTHSLAAWSSTFLELELEMPQNSFKYSLKSFNL